MMKISDVIWHMNSAIQLAEEAGKINEVPVGALILDDKCRIIGEGFNLKEQEQQACNHAEMIAIKSASEKLNSWRLEKTTMIVSLEPCIMCLGAIISARVQRLIFGAYDLKGGAISLGHNLYKDQRLNHSIEIMGGVEHFRCSKLMSDFFKFKREEYKYKKRT